MYIIIVVIIIIPPATKKWNHAFSDCVMSGWNRELIRSCDLMTFSLSWYSFWMSDLVFGCPGAIRYGWHVVPTPEPTKNGDPQIEMVKKNANFTETIQNICTRFALSHLKRKKEKEKKSVLLNVCLFGSCFRTLAVNLVSDPSNLPHLKMVPGFDFHSLEYSISACLQNFTDPFFIAFQTCKN